MTADELYDSWAPNPEAADRKYKTDGVEVSGVLTEINSGVIKIEGNSRDWRRATSVKVTTTTAKDGLAKCKIGQRVIVKGRSDGTTFSSPWIVADEVRPGN